LQHINHSTGMLIRLLYAYTLQQSGVFWCDFGFYHRIYVWSMVHVDMDYCITQNCGGGKLWQIWRIECHSPIFYPTKFISHFCKTRNFWIKNCTCMSRDWRCKLGCENVNLEISPFTNLSRSKIRSFRLTIFIFVITSKDTFYRKRLHRWSRDLQIIDRGLVHHWTQTTLAN